MGMLKRWVRSLHDEVVGAADAVASPEFSLNRLARENPTLAGHYLWSTNVAPVMPTPLFLHLGCGERVLDGFVNLDFIPHDERVFAWNLLDLWPDAWAGSGRWRLLGGYARAFLLRRAGLHPVQRQPCAATRRRGAHADAEPSPARRVQRGLQAGTGRIPAPRLRRGDRRGCPQHGPALLRPSLAAQPAEPRRGWRRCADSRSFRRPAPCRPSRSSTASTCATRTIRSRSPTICAKPVRSLVRSSLRRRSSVPDPVEDVADGVRLFVATAARPTVEYVLPDPMPLRCRGLPQHPLVQSVVVLRAQPEVAGHRRRAS